MNPGQGTRAHIQQLKIQHAAVKTWSSQINNSIYFLKNYKQKNFPWALTVCQALCYVISSNPDSALRAELQPHPNFSEERSRDPGGSVLCARSLADFSLRCEDQDVWRREREACRGSFGTGACLRPRQHTDEARPPSTGVLGRCCAPQHIGVFRTGPSGAVPGQQCLRELLLVLGKLQTFQPIQ